LALGFWLLAFGSWLLALGSDLALVNKRGLIGHDVGEKDFGHRFS
jgi:hypothetical protein